MIMFRDMSNTFVADSPCCLCGEMCQSEVITGDRRKVVCIDCYENRAVDYYDKCREIDNSETPKSLPTVQGC